MTDDIDTIDGRINDDGDVTLVMNAEQARALNALLLDYPTDPQMDVRGSDIVSRVRMALAPIV